MTTISQRLKTNFFQRFPSGVWLLTGLDVLMSVGFSIVFPFLALYLHNERGLPMTLVGVIFLVRSICSGTTNIIGGMFSDRFGRRRLLLTVFGIGIFGYSVMALLIGVTAPIWLIAVVYVMAEGIRSIIGPTMSAIVADLTPKERLAESYALVRVGGNVGFALGPAIGGYLITFMSYSWLFSIAAFVSLAMTILIFFFLRETFAGSKERVDLRSTLAVARDRPFLVFIICGILLTLCVAHLGSTLSVFSVERLGFTTAQYGLLLTTNGIMVVVCQYPTTYLVSKMSQANGLILGSLLYVLGWGTMGWVTSFGWAVMAIILITAGEVTVSPISSSVVAEAAPSDKRGRYMGFFALSQTVGFSITPLFGGVLLDHFVSEPRLLWGIIASAGVLAAVGFRVWGRMSRSPSQ